MRFRYAIPVTAILASVIMANRPAIADKFDEQYDLEKRIQKSDQLVRYARVDDDEKGVAYIKIIIDVPNSGSGSSDFAAIAQSMKKVTEFIYGQRAKYSYLRLEIASSAKDRYGNSKSLPDSVIIWRSDDLNKMNPSIAPEAVMALAEKVTLTRPIKDRARQYCALSELKDKRYCR